MPASTSCLTIAAPHPALAPVTTATFPHHFSIDSTIMVENLCCLSYLLLLNKREPMVLTLNVTKITFTFITSNEFMEN